MSVKKIKNKNILCAQNGHGETDRGADDTSGFRVGARDIMIIIIKMHATCNQTG